MAKRTKKEPKSKAWVPPPGYVAIQTYVAREIYVGLQAMRRLHDRSLRAEIRTLVTTAVKAWLEAQKLKT